MLQPILQLLQRRLPHYCVAIVISSDGKKLLLQLLAVDNIPLALLAQSRVLLAVAGQMASTCHHAIQDTVCNIRAKAFGKYS